MNDVGFIIGNGTSREGRYNLDALKQYGIVIGCNGVWREATPDYMVALDEGPVKKLLKLQKQQKFKLIYRCQKDSKLYYKGKELINTSGVEGSRFGNSGLCALWFALSHLKLKEVYLIGFDFFRRVSGSEPNEMYHQTLTLGVHGTMAAMMEHLCRTNPQASITRIGFIRERDYSFYGRFQHMKLAPELPQAYQSAIVKEAV